MIQRLFFILLMILWSLSIGGQDVFSLNPKIEVHSSEVKGDLSPLYRIGFFTSNPELDDAMKKTLEENSRMGTIEFYLIHPTITPSQSPSDLKIKLKEWDELALAIKRKGGTIVIEIAGMPLWLSSNPSKEPLDENNPEPKAYHAPPKDYNGWAKMVQEIVHHFNNELGLDAKVKIWGEPDWAFWLGTEEEYFKLYQYAVLGAKRANPKVKIGGPSVGWWGAVKQQKFHKNRPTDANPGNPMLYNFIEYCSNTSLPELGFKKLPIDFVVYHAFNLNPFSKSSYHHPANKIRSWLEKFGYNKNTEILIGEWNTWGTDRIVNHIFSSREHDTHLSASYIIATLIAMGQAGINSHSFAYFKDFIEGPEFAGDFALFTKNGIIKPSYNAMKLLGFLSTGNLSLSVNDPFIAAVASRDNKTISLLFSYFIPTGELKNVIQEDFMEDFKQELWGKGYTMDQLKSYGVTPEVVERLKKGETAFKDIGLPDKVREEIVSTFQKYKQQYEQRINEIEKRLTSPLSLEISFSHLPMRKNFIWRRYLIDASHSNSYPQRHQVEDAIKKARDNPKALQSGIDFLKERGFSGEEIQRLIDAYQKGKHEAILRSLPDGKKADLAKAIRIKNSFFTNEIDKINEWPEIKLRKFEEKIVEGTGPYREWIRIEPYSVNLIILQFN